MGRRSSWSGRFGRLLAVVSIQRRCCSSAFVHQSWSPPRRHRVVVPRYSCSSSVYLSAAPGGQSDPALEFTHPETNVTVVLLGCLHGSTSSEHDVGRVLDGGGRKSSDAAESAGVFSSEEQTDVLVLELCTGRFADMNREMDNRRLELERREQQQRGTIMSDGVLVGDGGGATGPGPADEIGSFLGMVRKTSQKRGLSAGIAAAILGGASGIQAALSGFDPGSEFVTALEMARSSNSGRGCNVALADRTVEETLRRVGSLPSVSAGMLSEWCRTRDWDGVYGTEARRLRSAIWGDAAFMPAQVDMGKALTRSNSVRGDLIRLTLPSLLFTQALTAVINGALDTLTGRIESYLSPSPPIPSGPSPMQAMMDVSATLTASDVVTVLADVAVEVGMSGLILAAGYVSLVLPAMKVVISERDEQLARGIRAACKLAVSKRDRGDGDGGGRVVAILGLLHVNGVAQRLLSSPPSPQEIQM